MSFIFCTAARIFHHCLLYIIPLHYNAPYLNKKNIELLHGYIIITDFNRNSNKNILKLYIIEPFT